MADPMSIEWLLGGDAAVRWQVMRDLLDEPGDVVAAERARVATTGWGARLLGHQDPEGTWAKGLYSPKWTSTTYTLLLLRQLGLPTDDPRARTGCELLLDGARYRDGGLTFAKTVPEPETCITAMVVAVAATFGTVDHRVEAALAWLLDQQLDDGGWNCESVRSGSRHGSFHTTIQTLEALQDWTLGSGADPAVEEAAVRGRGFFTVHRLYRSHRTGDVVDPSFTRMVFPPGWHHDLLRGLDHFQAVAAPTDPRLTDAVATLRSKRRSDGTWPNNALYTGRYWFRFEPAGQPSRVNTLRALRVLRWWDRPNGPPTSDAGPRTLPAGSSRRHPPRWNLERRRW
jgi:hypothetical protein